MDTARVTEVLAAFPEVTLAYVFGSRATGRASSASDLDVAVVTIPGADWPSLRAALAHALRPSIGALPLDLVLLDRAPIELAHAVISEGLRVFERSVAHRVEFEACVMGRYGDYLPVLRAQQLEIARRCDREARVRRYRAQAGRAGRASVTPDAPAGSSPQRL